MQNIGHMCRDGTAKHNQLGFPLTRLQVHVVM